MKMSTKGGPVFTFSLPRGGSPPCLQSVTSLPTTFTLNGFTRNAKRGFNSWKCSNLPWNSSNSLKIYFSVLPLCGLQLPLCEKHSFSF